MRHAASVLVLVLMQCPSGIQRMEAAMSMIDSTVEAARRVGAQHRPVRLREIHESYLEMKPDAIVGRSLDSFAATLNFHCINMRSRFPNPRDRRVNASWITRPLFKRVDRGFYMLLSESELCGFRHWIEQNDERAWRDEYDAEELIAGGSTGKLFGDEIPPPPSIQASPTKGDEKRIVERLLKLGKQLGSAELMFSTDSSVGNLLKDDPFAFLLAASIDRGMSAETAWRLPGKLKAAIGHLEPAQLSKMSADEMLSVLRTIDGRPRYLGDAARTLVEVAQYVDQQCSGDARAVWRNQPAATIRRTLTNFHGVGPGIASMILILLNGAKEIAFTPTDLAQMDPKPDVHVRRVFQRLGLCGRDPSETEVIRTARRIHPSYPGELDGPAWHIGRTWCHAQAPQCDACPLHSSCAHVL